MILGSPFVPPAFPWCANPRQRVDPETGEVVAVLPCNNWRTCPPCAKRKVWKVIRDFGLRSIPFKTGITLTMPSKYGDPTPENIDRQSRAIRKLIARIDYQRRLKRRPKFGIFWAREKIGKAGKDARLHLHVLTTIPHIDGAKLSELAKKSGFGWVVKIKQVHDGSVDYVTKELSATKNAPGGDWPTGTRRYGFRPPRGSVRTIPVRKNTARTRKPQVAVHVKLGSKPRSGR